MKERRSGKANVITKEGSDFIYYVDEEKCTVVAKLTVTGFDHIKSILTSDSNIMAMDVSYVTGLYSSIEYIGKATCSTEDKFDAEYGMKLAQKRALAKYYKARAKYTALIRDKLYELYMVAKSVTDYNVDKKEKFEKEE